MQRQNAGREPGAASVLPPDHPFAGLARAGARVIYADPPWRFETWSHRGQGKGASQHYATMSTAEICALPVADLAMRDCVLWLWGTWPHLPDALQVIQAWGFTYKSCGFVWIKQNKSRVTMWVDLEELFLGLGYGTRGNSEFCLHGLTGLVVLCGYPSPLYAELFAGWPTLERKAFADGARARTEVLWFNPAAWQAREAVRRHAPANWTLRSDDGGGL